MSTLPEAEFDLEKLFLPAWATESPSVNKYAGFKGEERRERRDDDRMGGRRPGPRRDGPRPGGPGGRPGGGRPDGGNRGPRPQGGGGGRSDFRGQGDRRDDRGPRPAPPAPPPEIDITIIPDDKGVELLARQIRMTGRAYPLFDIAQLILDKPERQQIRFEVVKGEGGKVAQPLYHCALDDTLWLSENEAVEHLLNRHFATFYQAEQTAVEPPKGTYTFVAQCGMSGEILGPPNYHGYQDQLRKLHTARFARVPFDDFKARVKIVRDEAVVKKWIEDRSTTTVFNCLNVPEPMKLNSRAEVEKHFREVHLPTLIKTVESHGMSGPASRQLRSPGLQRVLRSNWEDQRRFPLQVATTLSQQFAAQGLQFFKVNRTVTHVSVARPNFLDLEATPVSEGVRKIIDFINTTSKPTRRKLLETLAPSAPVATPAPAPAGTAPEGAPTTPAAAVPAPEATPEQAALAADLHWLVHQGHVIEFANGLLETAKKPLPKPVKAEVKNESGEGKKPAQTPAEPATQAAPTQSETLPSAEAEAPAVPMEPVAAEPAPAATAV